MSEGEKVIVSNRKARFEYHIEDTLEAGVVLVGTEVKALRAGRANLQDAFCSIKEGEMLLYQCHISPYEFGNQFNHDPLRPRKLLLNRREINKWDKTVKAKGYTIIPLKMYFKKGYAKVLIGLARGKRQFDKRQDMADRDSQRRLDRVRKGGTDE